jgi:hypothetical protein
MSPLRLQMQFAITLGNDLTISRRGGVQPGFVPVARKYRSITGFTSRDERFFIF